MSADITLEQIDSELRATFLRTLIEDVLTAGARGGADDSPAHRRDMIRTTFAAIEGSVWLYREHVRSVAKTMDVLTPFADLARRERTFNVSERGAIIEQVRYVTLPTIIRLAIRQARLIAPSLSIDFSDRGWSDLKSSLEVRHRITHPKSKRRPRCIIRRHDYIQVRVRLNATIHRTFDGHRRKRFRVLSGRYA
ncbi:hypothetical protein [Sphingomonas sp.]|uniref:hypothetical protein n=1 Tax=Sphingomonas sp. TaxID=28214 RepID=UPI0035BBC7C1